MDKYFKTYEGEYWVVRCVGHNNVHFVVSRFSSQSEAVDFCVAANCGKIKESRLLWLQLIHLRDTSDPPRLVSYYEEGLLFVSERLPETE